MTEPRQYDGGTGPASSSPVQQAEERSRDAGSSGETTSDAVAGPFTLREAVIGGSVLVMLIGTILPFTEGVNLWRTSALFFLGIGILLPVASLALLVGRRLGSENLRVGSLSVDQFASVAAALATSFFFIQTVTTFGIGQFIALLGSVGFLAATVGGPHLSIFKPDFDGRPSTPAHLIARQALPAKPRPPKPVPAEQVKAWQDPDNATAGTPASSNRADTGPSSAGRSAGYAVAGYAAGQQSAAQGAAAERSPASESSVEPAAGTEPEVGSPSSHQLEQEASPRAEVEADPSDDHENVPETPAPTMAHPAVQEDTREEPAQTPSRTESISATREAEDDEPLVEAFWFAVGTPRSVVDEQTGAPLFVLQPGDWEVGIEDRGNEFLVQDKRTGRIGVMRDLRNIERAPQE